MLHRHAQPAVAGAYLSGAVSGALISAAVLMVASGLLSPLPASARQVIAVTLVLILLIHAFGIVCLDLPQRAYQIPRETFAAAPTQAAYRFAFELGTGVRTYVTAVSPYAVTVLVVLGLPSGLGSATLAAASTGVGFGLGRSIVVASQSMRSHVAVDHPSHWLKIADRMALVGAFAILIVA